MAHQLSRIATIGNYLPRKCGIATFTTDLTEALAQAHPGADVFSVAITDTEEGYAYPPRARFEIEEQKFSAYRCAAQFLNNQDVDVVCLQHEFGIFGGSDGKHILALLNEVEAPIVTTLHTVIREPTPGQRGVMRELITLSDRLVVMSHRGADYLKDIYGAPEEKIDFIHHGIPDVPFIDPNFHKDKFGVEGKTVMLTFGLLSPNKGAEYVIEALPRILERYPNVVFIVLGMTHPNLVKREGEVYREKLEALTALLGVEDQVIFENRFVTLEELVEYIGAADIYVTPYLNEAQITSGTLAYTAGAGKAVISTPYWYAQEILADKRGLLVPFRDAPAIAKAAIKLLDGEVERHAMRKRAYALGRDMIWSRVASEYMTSFRKASLTRYFHPNPRTDATLRATPSESLPPLKIGHFTLLTDSTGMLQHAKYNVPDYDHGYTTDDNARALMLATVLQAEPGKSFHNLATLGTRYLAFLNHAFNEETGRFRNFMSYGRAWLEETGSEDSHGRALWALGVVTGRSRDQGKSDLASRLFRVALAPVSEFTSPRAWAFSILGIEAYLRGYPGHRAATQIGVRLAERLCGRYGENESAGDWHWFEDILAYANATAPHALMSAGRFLNREDYIDAGLASLRWLVKVQRMGTDHFVPIGSEGFYRRGGQRARFDQQPIEAQATVAACLTAFEITQDASWREEAALAFDWFLGRNDLGLALYDRGTGACFDGLRPWGLNRNQGAESTLACLAALAEMTRSTSTEDPAHPERAEDGAPQGGQVPQKHMHPLKPVLVVPNAKTRDESS